MKIHKTFMAIVASLTMVATVFADGEDIAMLRDKKAEGTLRSYSPAYKDDIDGA